MKTSGNVLPFLLAFLCSLCLSVIAFGQEKDGHAGVASPAQPGDDVPGVAVESTEAPESTTETRTWRDAAGFTHTIYQDKNSKRGQPSTQVEEIEQPNGTTIKKVTTATTTTDENGEETTITVLETTTTGKDGTSKTEKGTYETYTKPDGSTVTTSRSDEESDNEDGSSEQTTTKATKSTTDGYSDSTQSTSTDKTNPDGGQSSSSYSDHVTTDENTGETELDAEVTEIEADGSRGDANIRTKVKPGDDGKQEIEQTTLGSHVDADGNVTIKKTSTTGNVGEDGSGDIEVTEETEFTDKDGTTGTISQKDKVSDDGQGNVNGTSDYEGGDSEGNKVAGTASISQKTTDNSREVNTDASEEVKDANGKTGTTAVTGTSTLQGNDDGTISGQDEISGQATDSDGKPETMEGVGSILIKPGEGDKIIIESDSSVTADGPQGPTTQDNNTEAELGPKGMELTSDTTINGPGGGSVNVGETLSAGVDGNGNVSIAEDTKITGTGPGGESSTQDSSLTGEFDKNGDGFVAGNANASGQDSDGNKIQDAGQGQIEIEGALGDAAPSEPEEPTASGAEPQTPPPLDENAFPNLTGADSGSDSSDAGAPTAPGSGLRDAEPESSADVDPGVAAGGVNTSGSFANNWSQSQKERGADSTMAMGNNSQMGDAANAGNQTLRDADTARDSGGRDAQTIRDNSARDTAQADGQDSWGKALGDAIEKGVTEGGKSFGTALGGAAADEAVSGIFGTSKPDSESQDGASSKGAPQTGGTGATPTSSGGLNKGQPPPPSSPGGPREGNSRDEPGEVAPPPPEESAPPPAEGGGSEEGGGPAGTVTCDFCGHSEVVPPGGTPASHCPACGCGPGMAMVSCGFCGNRWLVPEADGPPGSCPSCGKGGIATPADDGGSSGSDGSLPPEDDPESEPPEPAPVDDSGGDTSTYEGTSS